MLIVDVITFLLGATILGLALYVMIDYAALGSVVSFSTVYISMAVGGVLILTACLGCLASRRGHKCLLGVYLIIITAALAAQIAATILISNFAGRLGGQDDLISSSITDEADRLMNNAIYSTYTTCCTGCVPNQNCTNILPYYNKTNGNCLDANTTFICQLVPNCANSTQDACFLNPDTIPPVAVDGGVCDLFESVKNNNVPLVGPAITGSCGGGSPNQYMADFVTYFNSVFYYFVIAFAVLCAIQFLNLMAAVFILCCSTEPPK